ncbi:MAG TPA: Z1 domain-containing protein [Candidatus Acidoferrales bacterium]|nr:Z1 domain-containing protein [Candidatus Acidoferrales bacterium]
MLDKLENESTSTKRPGILLGKVQSGKTAAYLGAIARAFDKEYGVAVILTKGTRSLAEQTLCRVKEAFRDFMDQVEVFDILAVPELTPYELTHKLIFVAKKEDDNLRRLLDLFQNQYPELRNRSVLIIDDEADLASVSARRIEGLNIAGTISRQIDSLRNLVTNSAFLQVTATPYALYLQPDDSIELNGDLLFKPKRPAFTVLLPTYSKYVGGDDYFEKSTDPDSPAFYFFREVPIQERDALKKEDKRRLQIDRVLTEKNAAVLRDAIVTFLVGGTIRRLQQSSIGPRQKPQKYSFLFHTEQSRSSHSWQETVARAMRDALVEESRADSPLFSQLVHGAYVDLCRSIELEGIPVPSADEVKKAVAEALQSGQLMITKVNSDNEIKKLLAEDGQLKLRTPFNMFIGGQILDRGITINNLIAFYYGRHPNRFQQDTVLQHSRMYGARSTADLAVTRFYAPQHVYQVMRRIHEFDGALREAFESGAHDQGVYFVQKDTSDRLIPCSPNKLLFSDVVSIRPGRRLVLSGFQTLPKSSADARKNLAALDSKVDAIVGSSKEPVLITTDQAAELLEFAFRNLVFDDSTDDDRQAHIVALEHLSQVCRNAKLKGKVWLLVGKDRNVARYREERFSNAPDTKQQKDAARSCAQDIPVLMMLRQNGDEAKGWRGLPFWWPVVLTPKSAVTVIFATKGAVVASEGGNAERALSTEEVA